MCGRLKNLRALKTQIGCSPQHSLFNLYKLYNRIQKNEGYSQKPYDDLFGNKTIGYGHLIKQTESFLLKGTQSKKHLTHLFVEDLNHAIKHFKKHYSVTNIPDNVQEVVVEMIFQLGIKNVLGFIRFNKYIKKKQLFMAALEMIDSRWYKQTPKRVSQLIKVMIYNKNEQRK